MERVFRFDGPSDYENVQGWFVKPIDRIANRYDYRAATGLPPNTTVTHTVCQGDDPGLGNFLFIKLQHCVCGDVPSLSDKFDISSFGAH